MVTVVIVVVIVIVIVVVIVIVIVVVVVVVVVVVLPWTTTSREHMIRRVGLRQMVYACLPVGCFRVRMSHRHKCSPRASVCVREVWYLLAERAKTPCTCDWSVPDAPRPHGPTHHTRKVTNTMSDCLNLR